MTITCHSNGMGTEQGMRKEIKMVDINSFNALIPLKEEYGHQAVNKI